MRSRYLIFIFPTILLFTTCKKYPKNNLWLTNPTKVIARGGVKTPQGTNSWKLDYYSVGGIDLTDNSYLDVYKEVGVVMFIDGNTRTGIYKFTCSEAPRDHF